MGGIGPVGLLQEQYRQQQWRMHEKFSNKEKKSLIGSLSRRLSWEHIKDEHRLIKAMSPNLCIPLQTILSDSTWKAYSPEKIRVAIAEIPFLTVREKSRFANEQVKMNYENGDRIVIVTGIQKNTLEKIIKQFNESNHKNQRMQVLSFKDMNQWFAVELGSWDAAFQCKKFIRGKKTLFDCNVEQYKISRHRVRIVLLSEDFYTILVDAMMETKTDLFASSFSKKPFLGLTYFPMFLEGGKDVPKVEEEQDDISWEQKSKSSDLYYEDKLKDIDIEKVSQGIQYEKIEAALTQQQFAVGEEQQGIWTQTEQNPLILNLGQTSNRSVSRSPEKSYDSPAKEQTISSIKETLEDEKRQQNIQTAAVTIPDEQIKENNSQTKKNFSKQKVLQESDNRTNPFKNKLRSFSTGLPLVASTNEYETQTSRIVQNGRKYDRQIQPATAPPAERKQHSPPSYQMQRFQIQAKVQKIQQLPYSKMRKQFTQYLTKVGRKQIDIPIYIKKEADSIIFKNKFLEEVIRQANHTASSSRNFKF